MSHIDESRTTVTCAAKPAAFLDEVLVQCQAHDHYPFRKLPGQLLDSRWADAIITPAERLPRDAEALEVLEELKKALGKITFDCPSCGVACSIMHFLRDILPLAVELAKEPAAGNLGLVIAHQSEATVLAALKALLNWLTHEVLAKYGSLRRGVYCLKYQVAKSTDHRPLPVITLHRFRPEQGTFSLLGSEQRVYRCCKVTPSGVEYLRNQGYLGGDQIWISDQALEEFEQELGQAFRGQGIHSTLRHVLSCCLDVKNLYDSEKDKKDDEDFVDDHYPMVVIELVVRGIKLGHFRALNEFDDDRLILDAYRPYEFSGEIDEPELEFEDHEFGSVLRKLLTLDELPEVDEVPGLSDEMLESALALATELQNGKARPYDIAALREFMRRTADDASTPVDPELLRHFLPQTVGAVTEQLSRGEIAPSSAMITEQASSSLTQGDQAGQPAVAKPLPK